ncbi:MAG: restriction endonuclease subunit S [Chloroflexota bacterium]
MQLKEAKTLPDGWRWVKLGEACQINPSRPSTFTRPDDAPTTFVPMAAVNERSGTIFRPEVRPYSQVSVGYTYFEEGDVLFAKITPCMQNGKHAIARNLIDGVGFGSTEFHVLRQSTVILPEWIYFFVRQPAFLREAESYFVGAVGQQRVPEIFLAKYHIPLPPLPEQKRIVAKIQESMKEVEHARAACEAQMEAAKALPRAYLRQVFESEEAKKWERRRLGEIIEDIQPGFACGKRAGDDGVIQLRMNNISSSGQLDLSYTLRVPAAPEQIKQYQLLPGDIVFNNTNSVELVGKTALFRDAKGVFVYSNHLTRLRSKLEVLDPVYLTFWLQLQWHQRLFERICNRWIGQAAVKREKLLALELPLPALPEQKRIAANLQDRVAGTEKLKSDIEKQLEAIRALPQAILKKAFSGEL